LLFWWVADGADCGFEGAAVCWWCAGMLSGVLADVVWRDHGRLEWKERKANELNEQVFSEIQEHMAAT
jgi:hypothetical protein